MLPLLAVVALVAAKVLPAPCRLGCTGPGSSRARHSIVAGGVARGNGSLLEISLCVR
jgi:hypothetical protein